MPIVRGRHRFDGHFTQIPNAWLRDYRLSYKARGLLAEILSHSAGFMISRERLARLGKDGRDSISSAIAELEACGYLSRKQNRLPDGRLAETVWTTKDPELEPLEENPLTAEPTTAEPHLKNTDLKNTEIKNNSRLSAEEFALFWTPYPRKVGRAAAEKMLAKILRDSEDRSELLRLIADGAYRIANDPNLPPKQFVPYPATWLGREGWLDEPYPERERTPEEKAEMLRERLERERQQREERAEAERKDREALRKHLEEHPVTRCQHDRVFVICPVCNPIYKGKQ